MPRQFLLKLKLPEENQLHWNVVRSLEPVDSDFVIEAESKEVASYCRTHPGAWIQFPNMVYAIQNLEGSDQSSVSAGSPSFKEFKSVYEVPEVACSSLSKVSDTWTWIVTSRVKKFASIPFWPRPIDRPSRNFIGFETLYLGSSGALFGLSAFCWLIFRRKLKVRFLMSFTVTNICFAIYTVAAVPGWIGLNGDVGTIHRVGDVFLFLGFASFAYLLYLDSVLSISVFRGLVVAFITGVGLVLVGTTADQMCLASTICILIVLLFLMTALLATFTKVLKGEGGKKAVFESMSIGLLLLALLNDGLVFSGRISGIMVGPIGFIAALVLFAMSIDEKVSETYRQRDYLLKNLESEVLKKTAELKSQSQVLEKAEKEKLIQEARLGQLAVQVAHDIRSPLSALEVFLKDLTGVPAERRALLEFAMERINQIAESLLAQNRFQKVGALLAQYTPSVEKIELNELLIKILGEKRAQYRTQSRLRIEFQSFNGDALLYSKIDRIEFSRVISNLINNAFEASQSPRNDGDLIIEVSLVREDRLLRIKIKDYGVGISSAVLPRLTEKGQTHGKVDGSGLGLYHARKTLEEWQGSLRIESTLGAGTTITLSLPVEGL